MPRLAVRLEPIPGADAREALVDAIDQANEFDCPVVIKIKDKLTLFLHPHTVLEDAQATYDQALAEEAERVAAAEKAKAAKGKAKPAPKAAPKPAEAKKPT